MLKPKTKSKKDNRPAGVGNKNPFIVFNPPLYHAGNPASDNGRNPVTARAGKGFYRARNVGVQEENDMTIDEAGVLSIASRRRRGNQMRRRSVAMSRARKIARTRFASSTQLKRRAQQLAIQKVRTRVAGQRGAQYKELSPSSKVAIDMMIQKSPIQKAIRRLAQRLIPVVRRKEGERLAHVRQKGKYRLGTPGTAQYMPASKDTDHDSIHDRQQDENFLVIDQIATLIVEDRESDIDSLLRHGLSSTNDIPRSKQVLSNPEAASKYEYLRERLLTLYEKILSTVLSNKQVFHRVRADLLADRDKKQNEDQQLDEISSNMAFRAKAAAAKKATDVQTIANHAKVRTHSNLDRVSMEYMRQADKFHKYGFNKREQEGDKPTVISNAKLRRLGIKEDSQLDEMAKRPKKGISAIAKSVARSVKATGHVDHITNLAASLEGQTKHRSLVKALKKAQTRAEAERVKAEKEQQYKKWKGTVANREAQSRFRVKSKRMKKTNAYLQRQKDPNTLEAQLKQQSPKLKIASKPTDVLQKYLEKNVPTVQYAIDNNPAGGLKTVRTKTAQLAHNEMQGRIVKLNATVARHNTALELPMQAKLPATPAAAVAAVAAAEKSKLAAQQKAAKQPKKKGSLLSRLGYFVQTGRWYNDAQWKKQRPTVNHQSAAAPQHHGKEDLSWFDDIQKNIDATAAQQKTKQKHARGKPQKRPTIQQAAHQIIAPPQEQPRRDDEHADLSYLYAEMGKSRR